MDRTPRSFAALLGNRFLRIIASLVLAAAALQLAAPARASAASSKAEVRVRAVVLSYFRTSAVSHPAGLQVSDADIARGYMDLPQASSFEFASNTRNPLSVAVAFDPSFISKVGVRMLGDEVTVQTSGGGSTVRNSHIGNQHVAVTYRLHLNSNARAGQYAWPVGLQISSLA